MRVSKGLAMWIAFILAAGGILAAVQVALALADGQLQAVSSAVALTMLVVFLAEMRRPR